MRDLTQGSITAHLLGMAAFIGIGLIFQTLYFIVDLYFVSRLGSAAIAGVSASGNGEGSVPDGGVESHPADNIVYSICSVRAMMSSCASGESAVKKAE